MNGVEQERLKRALDHLIGAQREALDVISNGRDEPKLFGSIDEIFMSEYTEHFYQYVEDQVMDSSAFQEEFGVEPTPLGAGLDATIAWYGDWLAIQGHGAS